MSTPTMASSKTPPQPGLPIARLTFYFGLVYFLQGVCQYTALINQPIKNFLRVTMGYNAEQSASLFFVVGLPWMIKPIYGLVSDYVPLLGYRRKTYLLLCNLAAAACFLWMSGITDDPSQFPTTAPTTVASTAAATTTPTTMEAPALATPARAPSAGAISSPATMPSTAPAEEASDWVFLFSDPRIAALIMAGVAVGVSVAAADVIVDALMVEFGQKTGLITRFQGIQWACIYGASMLTTVLASYLIQWFEPPRAVSVAALICVSMPLIVLTVTWWCVPEQKSRLDAAALKETTVALLSAFRSLRLWLVLLFMSLLAFNPGMWTPAYYYFTEKLNIPAADVAFADTYFNGGAMLASLTFLALPTKRLSIRSLQVLGIVVSATAMVPYCFIYDKFSLNLCNGIWGFGYMTGSLATLSLAAASCPRRAEGFVFATLLSASNFATSYSEVWGGRWYEGFAAQQLWIMVLISMGFTLIALPLVPFLPKGNRQAEDELDGAAPNRGVAG